MLACEQRARTGPTTFVPRELEDFVGLAEALTAIDAVLEDESLSAQVSWKRSQTSVPSKGLLLRNRSAVSVWQLCCRLCLTSVTGDTFVLLSLAHSEEL